MANEDRGQATIGSLVWIAVAIAVAIGAARVGRAAIDGARAATAADAAALAGAAAGDAAAETAAHRNDARIISVEHVHDGIQVTVRAGSATATARAIRRTVPSTGSGQWTGN